MTSGPVRAVGHAPRVDGKFLAVEGRRFLVKGVAYGTFAPDCMGDQFPASTRVKQDFALMAASGINTIRTYTVPPPELLDIAQGQGLRVVVGLPWPQHIAFLGDPQLARQIRRDAAAAVGRLASHPATLMFAVGNEIPAGIVRWHGYRRMERFLRELYEDVKTAAPDSLFTYVNFPPTEHLDLECFDVCAFNIYLHRNRIAGVPREAAAHRRRQTFPSGGGGGRQRARRSRGPGSNHHDAPARSIHGGRLRGDRLFLDR